MEKEDILAFLKLDAKKNLNFYNQKVITNKKVKIGDIVDKGKEIENKIQQLQKKELEDTQKQSEKNKLKVESKKDQHVSSFIKEIKDWKKEITYIPRIRMKKIHEKKESFNRTNSQKDNSNISNNNTSRINNSIATKAILYNGEFFSLTEVQKEDPFFKQEEDSSYSNKEESSEENDKAKMSYDKQIDINFFTNRYFEYEYFDQEEKYYDDSDILRHLFEKSVQRNIIDEWFLTKQPSPYLPTFIKLIELAEPPDEDASNEDNEKEENSESNDSEKEGNDSALFPEEKKKIEKIFAEQKSHSNPEGDYYNFFTSKMKEISSFINSNANVLAPNQTNAFQRTKTKNAKETETKGNLVPSLSFNTKANEISFSIELQGELTQQNRVNPLKNLKRGIIVKGPNVAMYKIKNKMTDGSVALGKEVGHFDIRDMKIDEDASKNQRQEQSEIKSVEGSIVEKDPPSLNKIKEDGSSSSSVIDEKEKQEKIIEIKKIFDNGREITEPTIFLSAPIVNFNNRTLKPFFTQVKLFYTELPLNIDNASYSVLRFLSNPKCSSLELSTNKDTHILDYLYWHPNLLSLTIKSSFTGKFLNVMKNDKWTCRIKTLTIIKDNIVSEFEKELREIFRIKHSNTIQNIHFIDIEYNENIKDALLEHVNTFYSFTNEEMVKISRGKLSDIRTTSIPILNLSIKNSPPSGEGGYRKSEEVIDLKSVYSLFIYMLSRILKYNKGTVPEVFDMLDISETVVKNVNYLVKIITKFKIIKRLNISNTIIENIGKLIEAKTFLSSIKLVDSINDMSDIEEYSNDDVYLRYEREFTDIGTKNENPSLGFDYSLSIFPILEEIYVYNTDIKEDIADEVYGLFTRLKFFRGFHYSCEGKGGHMNQSTRLMTDIVERVGKGHRNYSCENMFIFNID